MSSGFSHESPVNNSIEWYTPAYIFEQLGIEFDLDVCAPAGGIPWIPAKRYFSLEDDGLKQEWIGNVWMNPPYGRETKVWLKKFVEHGNGIAFVFSRTDNKWFHDYCAKADAINFLQGRTKFVDINGNAGGSGSPPAGSILVAIGEANVKAISKLKGLCLDVKNNTNL